jgi:putative ABC transport system permease protein
MVENFIKTAFHDIIKNKTFSLISITSLGLSIAVCLLFTILINDTKGNGHFQAHTNRIIRINTEDLRKGNTEPFASSSCLVEAPLAITNYH